MSVHEAIEFILTASGNPALGEAIKGLTAEAIVELGAEAGFSFTADELRSVADSPDVDPHEDGAQLSDPDLDGVSGGVDLMAVQLAMRESYLAGLGDLRSYADKVSYFNSVKSSIRNSR